VSIINCLQRFDGSEENIEEQIAAEISQATQDHIQLHFHRQSALSPVVIPYVAGRRGFLVRWGDKIYGSLQIRLIGELRDQHVLPIPLCERLAQDCAWSLHILGEEAEQQRKKQMARSDAGQKISTLSVAQYTVLEMMVKGFSTRAIADMLGLSKRTVETHQRNIYQILDVHSQREAVLIGLTAGLTT
jgi:DNA-binding CsgD family transcriptional regulator